MIIDRLNRSDLFSIDCEQEKEAKNCITCHSNPVYATMPQEGREQNVYPNPSRGKKLLFTLLVERFLRTLQNCNRIVIILLIRYVYLSGTRDMQVHRPSPGNPCRSVLGSTTQYDTKCQITSEQMALQTRKGYEMD